MRPAIAAIGAVLLMCTGTVAGTAAADRSTDAGNAAPPAGAVEWCGFENKVGSRVRCGYSSERGCKRAIGKPDAICIADPYLTWKQDPRADDGRAAFVNRPRTVVVPSAPRRDLA